MVSKSFFPFKVVVCLKLEFEVLVDCSDASAYSGVILIRQIGIGVERERGRERIEREIK